jgi:penicillin-binding protein 1B
MMQEVMRSGTASSVYKTFPADYDLVGKTGTTNDAKDSWFAGYSGDYLSVVWVGRDDNKPAGLTGATGALPVWTSLMQQISTQPVTLNEPDNIKKVWVNPYTGAVTGKACGGSREYPYIAGSQPSVTGSCVAAPADTDNDKSWIENLFSE